MSTNRLPKGHVYSGRGDIIDMNALVEKSMKPATRRDPTAEINPMTVSRAVQPRLRAQYVGGNTPVGDVNPFQKPVYSGNTPEGEETTLAELTGVKIDKLKHVKVVRPPTPQEVIDFAEKNGTEIAKVMTAAPRRGRAKTEAEKLAEEIGN